MPTTLRHNNFRAPGSVGGKVNTRHASHGLRFDVIRPTESLDEIKRRISRDFWEDKRPDAYAEESRNWDIDDQGRPLGSIHPDWWVGRAAALAACGNLLVYPVSGWRKDRHHSSAASAMPVTG